MSALYWQAVFEDCGNIVSGEGTLGGLDRGELAQTSYGLEIFEEPALGRSNGSGVLQGDGKDGRASPHLLMSLGFGDSLSTELGEVILGRRRTSAGEVRMVCWLVTIGIVCLGRCDIRLCRNGTDGDSLSFVTGFGDGDLVASGENGLWLSSLGIGERTSLSCMKYNGQAFRVAVVYCGISSP